MSSNEAYLDDLLKAMSEREEEAQNGVSVNRAEPTEPLSKSEPEPEAAELFAEPDAEELLAEPETEPDAEELLAEPETEADAGELLAEPETEADAEELLAEPEAEPEVEELFAEPVLQPEVGTEELFTEAENGLEAEELLAEPGAGMEVEALLSEPESLFSELETEPEAEELLAEPVFEGMTEKEEESSQNTKPSTDEVKDMTEEEILQLLQLSAGEGDQEEPDQVVEKEQEIADDDLDKLLKDMESGDDNLAEINDLLYKAENNQPVASEEEASAASSGQETENQKKGKKKKEKAPKPKKEKKGLFSRKKKDLAEEEISAALEAGQSVEGNLQTGAQQVSGEAGVTEDLFTFGEDSEQDSIGSTGLADQKSTGEKKPGFFSKIIDFLMEEDEDSEAEGVKDEAEQLKTTTDENQEVLKQLKKEDQEGKKKKKKKGKGKADAGEDAESDDEDAEEAGKEKKKKVKKEKKEKPPKPVDDTPQPKLSKKKVRATALFAFTIMAAILVCCLFIPELSQLSDARSAYYDGDYETCFRTLYGKRLSESDRRMFEQSQMMLAMNRNLEAYENYVAVGDELHALDILLQAVQKQEKLLIEAEKYGLAQEAEAAYQNVLAILAEKYQLTEADAIEINAYEQDVVYTLRVKSIVEGTEFVLPDYLQQGAGTNAEPQESVPEEIVEDVLSVEEELPDTEYEEGILEP